MGIFDELTLICKGGPDMTLGAGQVYMQPVESIAEWEQKADAIRQIYNTTLGTPPAMNFQPDIKIEWEKQLNGYKRVEISYNAPYGERMEGSFLIPDGMTSPRPGILAIQQTTDLGREQPLGNDMTEYGQTNLAYGRDLVLRGYPVFSYDLITAHSRCKRGNKGFDTKDFYEQYPKWSAIGCDNADISRALDVMQSFPEWIIPDRIASIGHSQGAGKTKDAMLIDKRVKVGVASCGVWPEQMEKNRWHLCRTAWWCGRPQMQAYCLTGKPFPTTLDEELASIAPRAIMLINAMNDYAYKTEEEMVWAENGFKAMETEVRKIYQLYGCPEKLQVITHREGHSFKPQYHEIAYKFIEDNL